MISVAQKELALALIRAGKLTTGPIAQRVGISRQTVQRLRALSSQDSMGSAKAPRLEIGLKAAGFEILAFAADHPHARQRRYRVRFGCCGKEQSVTEKALIWRMQHDALACNRCAVMARNRERGERCEGRRAPLPPVTIIGARAMAISGAWR